ncbi:hypothetical protein EG831_04615, partial [bacterium]|nr:hypothetical protein [bacterium]
MGFASIFLKNLVDFHGAFCYTDAMRIPFFDKRYYGLDKGSSGIKIAEITEARGRLAVTRLMKLSLPVEDLPLRPDLTPPAIVERLRVFCRGQGITGRSVAVNLSGAFVASRLFNLPVMSHAELQAYIQDHAQEYLPAGVSKDAVEFDFQILKEEVQTGAEMAQINLAAGRKEAVADVLAMTLGAGLYPSCVDASSLSLVNMFSLHPAFVPGRVSAIMDIGHSVTKTLVVRDGQVAFAYELAAGGDTVNRKLQEAFDLDYGAAEELKLLFSADHEADQAGTVAVAGREFPRESVRQAVREACASMADEIGRMQQLWKGGRPWQHVVITGGGAKTPG